MAYWLMKSEGDCYSISALKRDGVTAWTGIRNYQARNFMRDDMKIGDMILFYHSQATPSGVYGLARVVSTAHPDMTAFDSKDEHFDPRSKKDRPTWMCVDVEFVKEFKEPVSLALIKNDPHLKGIAVAQVGQRLSIMPVSQKHFERIVEMAN